jgi:hypothetical protein
MHSDARDKTRLCGSGGAYEECHGAVDRSIALSPGAARGRPMEQQEYHHRRDQPRRRRRTDFLFGLMCRHSAPRSGR